jgi:EmrB/QacA subfamily drug resistance transporter
MLSTAVRGPCDEAAIRHGVSAAPCSKVQKRWVLVAAIVGSSMAFIDGTVVNVALPAIQRDLRASVFEAQWVVESYALFLAALLLVGGSLGDRFGRRRVFAIGVAIFGLASLACAAAQDVQQLIAARAVQGVGAALLVPGSLALISATFPESERGRAIGTWSGFSGITAALGPVLGGWLVDHFSWAWAFLINLPFALAVLVVTWRHVPESRNPQAPPALDLVGALLATLGLGGVVYAFIEAPTQGWHAPPVLLALFGGLAALLAFVVTERRHAAPMLPLAMFRNRNFAGANLLTLWLYAALGGGLFFLPLNLIQVQGYSATAAGAALLPFILIMFVLSRWAGRLVDTVGPRRPLVIGPLIAAAGFAALALPSTGGSYWSSFLPGIVVLGLGMTVTVAPLTTTVMNAVGPDAAGTASGINNAVSRVAALLAVAIFGGVMAWAFERALHDALQAARLPDELIGQVQAQRSRLAALEVPSAVDPASAATVHRAVADAFVAGFRWVMAISAALALASSLAAAWLISGRSTPSAPTPPRLQSRRDTPPMPARPQPPPPPARPR